MGLGSEGSVKLMLHDELGQACGNGLKGLMAAEDLELLLVDAC